MIKLETEHAFLNRNVLTIITMHFDTNSLI